LVLFTTALNSAVGRFMTMALDRHDNDEANRIFNTSFWGSAGILLFLLGPCLWLFFHSTSFFSVPIGMERDFMWLALTALGMFCLTTLSSAFSVTSFCRNRFDLSNFVNITNTMVRISLIVLLFHLFAPRVWHVGLALFVATLVSGIGAILICRQLTPMLQLRMSWFSLLTLRKMIGMGGWIVIDSIGAILYLSIDLVVVNKLLGPEATGRYGAVLMWSALLRTFAGVIAGVFAPTIFILFSRNDIVGLVSYSRRAVKFVGIVLAIPIGLICGLSKPLLHVWLGSSFVPLAPLMSLMIFHLCVNLAVLPLYNVQVATNHVRLPGIVTCVMGLLNLCLAIALVGPAGWGMYGVAAAGAIMLTTKNIVFTPLYAAKILGVTGTTFFLELVPIVGLTIGLSLLGWVVATGLNIQSMSSLVASGIILGTLAGAIAFTVILNSEERSQAVCLLFARNRNKGA
jgi:membrane protein EpsK